MMTAKKRLHRQESTFMQSASAPFKALRTVAHQAWISIAASNISVDTEHLKSFLVFTGYPRSGSSTLGSLLDAHSQILVSHELNVLKYLQRGYGRRLLLAMIARNSRRFADSGRNSTGYKGLVEGQYNGMTVRLHVIGDKKAGRTALMLAQDNLILDRLQDSLQLPLKCRHLVRNPFDMITTQAYGGNTKKKEITAEVFRFAGREFFERFDAMQQLLARRQFDVYTLRYEDLLEDPAKELDKLIRWLGVDSDPTWCEACCKHLYRNPHKSRTNYPWSAAEIADLTARIERYDFLRGYTFEN